jgi:hypothetical protein
MLSPQLLDRSRSRVKLYILGMVQGVQLNSAALQPDQSETIMTEDT